MKRKYVLITTLLILICFWFIFPAEALITTRNYGWILGKYNVSSETFSPPDTSRIYYLKYFCRTIGPVGINVDGTRQGEIIAFNDVNDNVNDGYPMVGEEKWDEWIDYFGGTPWYVKAVLNQSLNTKSIKTKSKEDILFANFSELVEKCGGKGLSYDIANGTITYQKTPKPTSGFSAVSYAIKPGQKAVFNISARTFSAYGGVLFITFQNMNDGYKFMDEQKFNSNTMSSVRELTLSQPGTYTFKLTARDANYRNASEKLVIINVAENPVVPPQPPPDEPPPEEPVNQPPVARFSWPSSIYEGDNVTVTENSFDWDGQVVDWNWSFNNTNGVTSNLGQGGGTATFANSGTYNLSLTVTDDQGLTGSVSHSIIVNKPIPTANITNTGTLKQNRKITLDSSTSTSPAKFPIDFTLDEWTITPVSGGTASDVKLGTKTGSKQDVLFKAPGVYKAALRVHNSKYPSEWAYKDLIIVPDDPPIANFTVPAIIFRNPADQSYASINPIDRSYSLDGDTISQRTWKYKFDSDNDGSFLDETWVILDNANNVFPVLRTNKVGKYLFELEVKESFGQETILSFITDADYKRSDTTIKPQNDKINDVQNIAPVTSFAATVKPKVDIVFSQGFLNDYNNRFPLLVNNLEPLVGSKLKANNIDYAFYNTAFQGGGVEHIQRTSEGPWGPDEINDVGEGYCVKTRILDLGKSVSKTDVVTGWINYNGYCLSGRSTNFSIAVSNDNINWYVIHNWISPPNVGAWRPSNTVSITPSIIPINSFRYIKGYINATDYALDGLSIDILFNSQNTTINKSNSNTQKSTVLDLGQSVPASSLSEYRMMFQGTDGTYTLAVSPDNVTWSNVSSWACSILPGRTNVYEYKYISKTSIPIQNFRYTRLSVTGSTNITYYQQFVTFASGTRATLNDIQAAANQPYRANAIKYVVSLAEEPYIDSNSSMLTHTANALKNNNVKFVAFTNSTSLASVQQLTSNLTDPNIITTTNDLSAPLSQLADYIINTNITTPNSNSIAVLIDQSLSCSPSYSDYEADPKFVDNWYYVHEPTYVDNNTGVSFYDRKALTDPVTTFDKVGKYDVTYKAMDDPSKGNALFLNYRLWSNPTPTSIIVHRKPVANFSVQPGTLNVTDLSYDPDFQYKRPDKGVVTWSWKWRKSSSTSWTTGIPSGITELGDYVIHLEVKDVYGAWSDPYEKTITVATLQKQPVVDFDWTPALIYEGDTVTLINRSYDPNGDPLTYLWTVYNPLGITNTFTSKNVSLSTVLPGIYWVTLRAWDPAGLTDAVTKSFAVNVLGVTGHINHTPEWNANRITYNRYYSGTDDAPRGYNVFWAGEKFVLAADTTDTGLSATRAQSVTVSFPGRGVSAGLTPNAARTSWTGELFRPDFETIPDGTYTFRFMAVYSNGTVKNDEVFVIIRGSWEDYYRFHRSL
ncbi:MAG: PKD domain-containing protein [Eubacteriales bacterium]